MQPAHNISHYDIIQDTFRTLRLAIMCDRFTPANERRFTISSKKRDVSQDEYETLAAFRYHLRRFLHFSEEAAQQVGLTPQQHQAMLTIKGFPDRDYVTIGELAERLQIKHHSAVGLVNRLVGQGLVRRKTGTEDRRQVYISLTEHGIELLSELTAAHKAELRRVRATLQELMDRLT